MYIDKDGLLEHYYGPGGKVILPAAARTLATELFLDRTDITEVVLNNGLSWISIFTFCGSGIRSVYIPDSVTWVSIGAFARCQELTEVRMPKELFTVDMDVFYNCKKLRRVILPELLQEIEQDAFHHCISLEEIELPEGLFTIGAESFAQSGLRTLRIPASVEEIETEAFDGCQDLTHVLIEGDSVSIAEDAFPEHTVLIAPHLSPEELPERNRLLAAAGFAKWCAEGNHPPGRAALSYRFFMRTHAKELYRLTAEHRELAQYLAEEGLLPEQLTTELSGDPLDAIEALFRHVTE